MSKTILAHVDGFTPLIDAIVERYGVICGSVFGMIWRYCQMANGVCTASQSVIATRLKLTRQCVNGYIALLVDNGYLEDLTPEIINQPHTYRDTGKAGLEASFRAFSKVDGVNVVDTKAVGVNVDDSGVIVDDTGCKPGLQHGVNVVDLKKDSLRNDLKKRIRNADQWQMVQEQLKMSMQRATYSRYIETILPFGLNEDNSFTLYAQDENQAGWVESRMRSTIERHFSGLFQRPVTVQVIWPSVDATWTGQA